MKTCTRLPGHILEGFCLIPSCDLKVKDKEAQLKSSEQKLHDEFERMRKQHGDEKKQLDDKRTHLVTKFNSRAFV